MTPQALADARTRLERLTRHRTHWAGCREEHPACMALVLLDELEEAQAEIARLRASIPEWVLSAALGSAQRSQSQPEADAEHMRRLVERAERDCCDFAGTNRCCQNYSRSEGANQ